MVKIGLKTFYKTIIEYRKATRSKSLKEKEKKASLN
jgi:hypothetical protein